MKRSGRFEFRCDEEEIVRLRRLAEVAGRTPSDLLRVIVRQLDPSTVNTGIPSSLPVADREAVVTTTAAA